MIEHTIMILEGDRQFIYYEQSDLTISNDLSYTYEYSKLNVSVSHECARKRKFLATCRHKFSFFVSACANAY